MYYKNVAKGSNSILAYIFTIGITILGYILGQIPMYIAMYYSMQKHEDIGVETLEKFSKNPDFSLLHIDKNIGFILILMIFIFALLALYVGVTFIHKRKFITVINSVRKIDWKRVFWSTSIWFGMLLFAELIMYFQNPDNYTFRDPNLSFLFLAFISLLILPIQTTFEEVFTRGYLLQSVVYNSKSVFMGFFVSILVFASLHGANPETFKYGFWPMMSYYIIAAVLLGLIVVFDKRLELAIGVHTATNIFGAMIVTYDGAALQTDSLFLTGSINPIAIAIEIFILGVIFLFIAKRKYKWNISKAFRYE